MELKTYFAQDAAGNIISSAVVKVFLQGTTTLATGLTRADGTPLDNPFAADGAGRIQFRAPDGYYDIQVSAGSGIIQTLTIQCVDYSGAKADADRAEAAAERADVSSEQVADAVALRGDLADPEKGDGIIATQLSFTGAVARTQHDKNQDYITIADFGPKGDGTTNDTAVFAAFELVFKNKSVDLNGKKYLVTDIPKKNKYFNGSFLVYKSVTTTGTATTYTFEQVCYQDRVLSPPVCVPERDARVPQSSVAYKLVQSSGLQSICFDEVNRKAYGFYLDTSTGSERSVLVRYDTNLVYPASASPDLTANASALLGHQGLGIELRTNADPKLWGACRYSTTYPLAHRQVMRFNVADAEDLSNVEMYTLFGEEFAYTGNSTMVCVSYDQKYLIACGRKTARDFWVRVFDLKALVAGGAGDYSDSFLYQFNIDQDILADDSAGAQTPVQNLACDGSYVYVVAGNSGLTSKKIHCYSLTGVRSGVNNTVSVGMSVAQADGTFYEPEAITFYQPIGSNRPILAMLFVTTGKNNYIMEMGVGSRVYSGVWTPAVTMVSNVTAVTAYKCNYSRVDDIVTISGRVGIQATAAGAVNVRLSLPVPLTSAASLTQAQGTFNDSTTQGGRIQLDTATGLLDLAYTANVTTITAFSFTASYRITN